MVAALMDCAAPMSSPRTTRRISPACAGAVAGASAIASARTEVRMRRDAMPLLVRGWPPLRQRVDAARVGIDLLHRRPAGRAVRGDVALEPRLAPAAEQPARRRREDEEPVLDAR